MKIRVKNLIILSLPIIALLVFNFLYAMCNDRLLEFFETPLYAIINIAIAVFFAYYLTQFQNYKQKKREFILGIVDKLIVAFSNEKMVRIQSEDDVKTIRLIQRSNSNRIALLKKYEDEFNYSEELKYISENFDDYWEVISDNITDINHLLSLEKDLSRRLSNIINKLESLSALLYS